jgi:uncharacterized lipoprotein YddW (UPF0748 family)
MLTSAARWTAGASAAALALTTLTAPHIDASDDVRALWMPPASLTSSQVIDETIGAAKLAGFNTVLVQVRARGDAYFLNSVEPRPASLSSQPAFDPLAEAIAKGHARGLAVHAWINVNRVTATDVPASRAHIVYRHPEWLMVPRQIADDLSVLESNGPEYLGRLMRFTRSQADDVDGLYLSPATDESIEYTSGVVRDIVQRYAVDGVHFDDLRYPSDAFDYGRETLRAFGQSAARFPDRWRQFRADRLTALLTELRRTVRSARPSAVVSVAFAPDQAAAFARHLQDWNTWRDRGLLDVLWRPSAEQAQLGKAAFSTSF